MGAYRLAEIAVNLIQDQIKATIATALADVRTQRGNALVTTEPPREYFIYEDAHGYRCPAVFTIFQEQDIRNEAMGANHINAMDTVLVAVLVEDRKETLTTLKAWRYQAALMQCLHQVSLLSSDNAVRLFVRVQSTYFSGLVNLTNKDASEAVFRKEVGLRLQVEHIENLE